MTDTYIDIVTDLPIGKVKQKLSDVTLQGGTRQTTYQQKYIGEIGESNARIEDVYSARNRLNHKVYRLSFLPEKTGSRIRVTTNEYEKRQVEAGLLKGLLIPLGYVALVIIIIFCRDISLFILFTCVCLLIIIPCIIYKAKPWSRDEYESDPHIQYFKTLFQGAFNSDLP